MRNVLLVHDVPERLAWLTDVVSREHHAIPTRAADEAMEALASKTVHLVVAAARFCSSDLLLGLAAHHLSRAAVFLAGTSQLERLLDGVGYRHVFHVLHEDPTPEELLSYIRSILSPRGAVRHELRGIKVQLSVRPGKGVTCPLLDLSNRGLALFMRAAQGLLFPGTPIPSLRLVRGPTVLLDGVPGTVRHVGLLSSATSAVRTRPAYRVGVEFHEPQGGKSQDTEQIVEQPMRLLAVLQQGLCEGRLTVRAVDANHTVATGSFHTIDHATLSLRIAGRPPPGLATGDVVRANFEHAGISYYFFSSLILPDDVTSSGYALKLPRALRIVRRRRSPRIHPPPDGGITVALASPFDGSALERPVLNITASGLAFSIFDATELFPVGTHIPTLGLRFLNQSELRCAGVVRTLVPAHGKSKGRSNCGVEFDWPNAIERAKLADAIVHCGQPDLKDGTGTALNQLWNFLLRTRFLYPEKLHSLDVPAVKKTMSHLLAEQNDVLKTLLVVKDGAIAGHASALRVYSRTWFLQHLATIARGKTPFTRGRLLNVTVMHYLEQIPEIEWARIWYRPNNRWPTRVFGTFARAIPDPELSQLVTLEYLTASTKTDGPNPSGVVVRRAVKQDLRRIEAYFLSRDPLLLRSDDLSSDDLTLTSVGKTYASIGLERRREILVAERRSRFLGFALVEVTSPGLNFSELTNAFRIYATDEDVVVRRALIRAARQVYAEVGREHCVALASRDDVALFQTAGFEWRKQYACWTWHRSLYGRFCEHILKLHVRE